MPTRSSDGIATHWSWIYWGTPFSFFVYESTIFSFMCDQDVDSAPNACCSRLWGPLSESTNELSYRKKMLCLFSFCNFQTSNAWGGGDPDASSFLVLSYLTAIIDHIIDHNCFYFYQIYFNCVTIPFLKTLRVHLFYFRIQFWFSWFFLFPNLSCSVVNQLPSYNRNTFG